MDRRFESTRTEIEDLFKHQRDIQRTIRRKQQELLKNLPSSTGFSSVDDLVLALARFASPDIRQRLTLVSTGTSAKAGKTRYDAEVRQRVRHGLENGKSAAAISREEGIPEGTIVRWKQTFGLVKKRRRASHPEDGLGSVADSRSSGTAHSSAN